MSRCGLAVAGVLMLFSNPAGAEQSRALFLPTRGSKTTVLNEISKSLSAHRASVELTQTFEGFRAGYSGSPNQHGFRGLAEIGLSWQLPRGFRLGTLGATYNAYSERSPLSEPCKQIFSNLTAPKFHRWREVFLDLPITSVIRLKAGKVDANSEFAVIEAARGFSNASMGASPTMFAMPSYPNGAASLNVFVALSSTSQVRTGVYRANNSSWYWVSEVIKRVRGKRPLRLVAGATVQSTIRSSDRTLPQNRGSYFIYEQTLVPRSGGRSGLRAFARLTTGDEAIVPATAHFAYGVTWTGFGERTSDSIGAAVLSLVLPSLNGVRVPGERVYEVYYRRALGEHVALKTDMQRIERAAGAPRSTAGLVASVRLIVNLKAGSTEQ